MCTANRELFLPNVTRVMGSEVVQTLYTEVSRLLDDIRINNMIIEDVNKMTLAIFNAVLSSMMEDEIQNGVTDRTVELLRHHQFTFSVLALSYDTAIFLSINNNFDIVDQLSLFSISPFDLQRVTDRFTEKLNQQSSFLVTGDIRNHFNRILDTIVDWAIWKEDSEIWNYLGIPGAKIPISVEVFIRHLLYYSLRHMKQIITCMKFSEQNAVLITDNAWQLIKYIIQKRTYLIKSRNMNSIIICSIYAIAKLFKIEVTFLQLLSVFESLYPESLRRTKYNINLTLTEVKVDTEKKAGNIIEFYNFIFVVVNNEYLVKLKKNILSNMSRLLHDAYMEAKKLESTNVLSEELKALSVQDTIIEEAKRTVSTLQESSDSPSSSLGASLAKRMSLNKTEERAMDALVGLASMSPARNTPLMKSRAPTPLPADIEEQTNQASSGSASDSTQERNGEAEKETDSSRKRSNEEREDSAARRKTDDQTCVYQRPAGGADRGDPAGGDRGKYTFLQ